MNSFQHPSRAIRPMVGAVMAITLIAASTACAVDGYTVTDLGVLPGGAYSSGLGINTAGQTTGSSDAADAIGFGQRGFLVSGAGMINLGLPPVPFVLSSTAPALNDVGQIIVNASNGAFHAFLWHDGAFTDLTTLPDAIYSEGHRVNNAGHAVGSVVLQLPGGSFPHHAFLHDGMQMIDLNPLLGGDYSDASDISDNGTIVGAARLAGSSIIHGYLLRDGRVTDIGPAPGITSEAESINAGGRIAGGAYFDGLHEHPMQYADGRMTDLGLLPQATAGTATAINDTGVITGYCVFPGWAVKRAFVYSGGQMKSLTELVPPGSGWTIEEANDINLAGTIVATARDAQGRKHAVKLTPVSTCPPDLNGDGMVNGVDLGLLLGQWGSCSGCAADFTGDGVVNGIDLATLLAAWGPCA